MNDSDEVISQHAFGPVALCVCACVVNQTVTLLCCAARAYVSAL